LKNFKKKNSHGLVKKASNKNSYTESNNLKNNETQININKKMDIISSNQSTINITNDVQFVKEND